MPKRDDRRVKKASTSKLQAGVAPPVAPADVVRAIGADPVAAKRKSRARASKRGESVADKIAGKHFSRVRKEGDGWVPVEPDGSTFNDYPEVLAKKAEGAPREEAFRTHLRCYARKSADYLRKRGYPTSPFLALVRTPQGGHSLDEHVPGETPMTDVQKVLTLDEYVIDGHDIDPDSPAGFAARIIVWQHIVEHGPSEWLVEAAYRLGELATLDNIYALEQKQGQRPKPKKQAARWRELARRMIDEDPTASAQTLWDAIPTDHDTPREHGRGASIYRDGAALIWNEGGRESEIAFETFRRHVRKAREE